MPNYWNCPPIEGEPRWMDIVGEDWPLCQDCGMEIAKNAPECFAGDLDGGD